MEHNPLCTSFKFQVSTYQLFLEKLESEKLNTQAPYGQFSAIVYAWGHCASSPSKTLFKLIKI